MSRRWTLRTRRRTLWWLALFVLGCVLALVGMILATHEGTLIVAHRGASVDAPENTLPAFELAWAQGADAIEGDFWITRDGQIVCIHEGVTSTVSDVSLNVSGSTLSELRQVDVGVKHGEVYRGTEIPTLAEVLATVPEGKKVFLDIKCGGEIIPALLEQIESSSLKTRQVIIISFSPDVLRELRAQAPQYKVLWLCKFQKDASGNTLPTLETVREHS